MSAASGGSAVARTRRAKRSRSDRDPSRSGPLLDGAARPRPAIFEDVVGTDASGGAASGGAASVGPQVGPHRLRLRRHCHQWRRDRGWPPRRGAAASQPWTQTRPGPGIKPHPRDRPPRHIRRPTQPCGGSRSLRRPGASRLACPVDLSCLLHGHASQSRCPCRKRRIVTLAFHRACRLRRIAGRSAPPSAMSPRRWMHSPGSASVPDWRVHRWWALPNETAPCRLAAARHSAMHPARVRHRAACGQNRASGAAAPAACWQRPWRRRTRRA